MNSKQFVYIRIDGKHILALEHMRHCSLWLYLSNPSYLHIWNDALLQHQHVSHTCQSLAWATFRDTTLRNKHVSRLVYVFPKACFAASNNQDS